MPGGDPPHPEILGSVASKLQDLGSKILEDSSGIHSGGRSHPVPVGDSVLEESMDSAHGELQPGLNGFGLSGLLVSLALHLAALASLSAFSSLSSLASLSFRSHLNIMIVRAKGILYILQSISHWLVVRIFGSPRLSTLRLLGSGNSPPEVLSGCRQTRRHKGFLLVYLTSSHSTLSSICPFFCSIACPLLLPGSLTESVSLQHIFCDWDRDLLVEEDPFPKSKSHEKGSLR